MIFGPPKYKVMWLPCFHGENKCIMFNHTNTYLGIIIENGMYSDDVSQELMELGTAKKISKIW